MTIHPPTQPLRFYLTPEHGCPYLPERTARTAFLEPGLRPDRRLHTALSASGFRRSGSHVYRPHCPGCNACIPIRIPVHEFRPDRNQRRILKRNADLTTHRQPARFDPAHFELYRQYQRHRHPAGEMQTDDPDRYMQFLTADWAETEFVEFRKDGQLSAVAVTDRLDDGLSAVYTFFDPASSRRSPGIHAILWQIDTARAEGLEWVYLGYFIRECGKMNYKNRFRPYELYRDGAWQREA